MALAARCSIVSRWPRRYFLERAPDRGSDLGPATLEHQLVLAGSETSPNEAGYFAGAVETSTGAAAEDVLSRLSSRGGIP